MLIANVVPEGPAAKAGLQRGDVVTRINGQKMDSSSKLRNTVAVLGNGGTATIQYTRDGKTETAAVTLGEMPATLGGVAKVDPNQGVLGGLTLGSLNPVNREKYKLPDRLTQGAVIMEVAPESPAHSAGLQPGDVLLELNRQPIPSVQAFTKLYRTAEQNILLLVYRDGSSMYLVLRR